MYDGAKCVGNDRYGDNDLIWSCDALCKRVGASRKSLVFLKSCRREYFNRRGTARCKIGMKTSLHYWKRMRDRVLHGIGHSADRHHRPFCLEPRSQASEK